MTSVTQDAARPSGKRLIRRHSVVVRITHWVNALCLFFLLLSGLQIFNAHPALYWGNQSNFEAPWFATTARREADGTLTGLTSLAGRLVETTGFLGASANPSGELQPRGFPSWLTIPSYQDLATGRRWHFFFAWIFVANGLIYLLYSLLSGHAWRDLVPSRDQLRHIGGAIRDHLRFRFPHGQEATAYNVLQKLSYMAVAYILLPLLVLAGLTMSPGLNAAFPELVTLFGGRQSARTIHFLAALGLVAFVFVHVFMVLVSGVWNNLRSMITGRYAIDAEDAHER